MNPCANCQLSTQSQDFQELLEYYEDFVANMESVDVRMWPDYHRGSHRARIRLAKDVVGDLKFRLNRDNNKKQVRQDL